MRVSARFEVVNWHGSGARRGIGVLDKSKRALGDGFGWVWSGKLFGGVGKALRDAQTGRSSA